MLVFRLKNGYKPVFYRPMGVFGEFGRDFRVAEIFGQELTRWNKRSQFHVEYILHLHTVPFMPWL
mgnify:CR=1 FL=1|jgi:hypothetical protein